MLLARRLSRASGAFEFPDVNYLYQGVREALKEEVEKQSEVLGRAALYRKTSKIARLPSYLTVNFVRFFWRRDTSKKAKILRVTWTRTLCARPQSRTRAAHPAESTLFQHGRRAQKVKFPVVLDVYDFCTDELKAQLDPLRAKFREFDDKQAEKRVRVHTERARSRPGIRGWRADSEPKNVPASPRHRIAVRPLRSAASTARPRTRAARRWPSTLHRPHPHPRHPRRRRHPGRPGPARTSRAATTLTALA